MSIEIRPLGPSDELCERLARILIDAVGGGASLTFMDPLEASVARAFWQRALADAERGERIVLGAFDGELLVGTVSVVLDMPSNQQHRAEIGKMVVCAEYRGRGIAADLMREAEVRAARRGRTLLVLDTAVIGGASGFYERLGFTYVGTIPDFASLPQGGLTGAMFYWKRIC